MPKAKILYIIDLIVLISFLVCAIGGYVIFFFMPATRHGALSLSVLGLSRHTWASIHQLSGHVFALAVITHFLLHWSWFVRMTKKIFLPEKKREHEG